MSALCAAGVRMTYRSLPHMGMWLVRVPHMRMALRFVADAIVTDRVVQPQRQRPGAGDRQCYDSDSLPQEIHEGRTESEDSR